MNQIISKRKVILGVAESDSHIVANHLIAFMLRAEGFEVLNLGACTSVEEFTEAYENNEDAEAILIGSLNGHACRDLAPMKKMKSEGRIKCPVILGGNLSVGYEKNLNDHRKFFDIGIDRIIETHLDIIPLLNKAWL